MARWRKQLPVLSHEEKRRAWRMRAEGMAWVTVARHLGITEFCILSNCDPTELARIRLRKKGRYRDRQTPTRREVGIPKAGERWMVPPEVEEARDRYLAAEHTSISGWLLGDPKPGFSALDRKREQQCT